MMMKLQKYDYEVQYERGTNLYLANTLSRAYLPTTLHPTGGEIENINATAFLSVSTSRLQEIQQATEVSYCVDGQTIVVKYQSR